MKTICVTKKDTNEAIACIPLCDGEKGIYHKDYDIKLYDGTEPYFYDTGYNILLSENVFGIKL
jgi:hypothetical protein